MQAVYMFFSPTVPKLIFTAEWVAYIILGAIGGWLTSLHQLIAAFCLLLLFYCTGCVLVAWSQRAKRVASGRWLALLVVVLIALDQVSKTVISARISQDTVQPLINGWLYLANVHNVAGSWLTPIWFRPVLILVAIPVLPLLIIGYHYYVSTTRKSLWADLAFLGVFSGYASWCCDVYLRGYVVDFVKIPGIVVTDFKDLFLSLGICVIIEALDSPGSSLRWGGWRAELKSTRRLITDIAVFTARDLRSWWIVVRKKLQKYR